jgi:hypothetical protein
LKLIREDLHDVDGAYSFVFEGLCVVPILKNIIREYKGIPRCDFSTSTRDDMFNHIVRYVKRNFPKDNLFVKLTELVLESNDKSQLQSYFAEPTVEADLKPAVKEKLQELGYTPYDKEVEIPPATRADVIGYRRRYDVREREVTRGHWEEVRVGYYEFVGIELKTAKRSKDPLFRQASVYTDYFDYSYTTITPLALLEQGYEYIDKFYRQMQAIGMGIILASAHVRWGWATILRAKEKRPKESNRRYLASQLGLVR